MFFINTSRFNEPKENYASSIRIPLLTQTASTIVLTKAALWGVRKIYRRRYKYQKTGVMLSSLVSEKNCQSDLLGITPVRNELMGVIDRINDRMGQSTIRLDSEGLQKT